MSRAFLIATTVLACASLAAAQETAPATRQEALERARRDKVAHVEPYKPSGLERALLKIENDRLFEKLFLPSDGFFPTFGSITRGGGFAGGGGYRRSRLLDNRLDLRVAGAASLKKYWAVEAHAELPRLANRTAFADFYVRRHDYPQEDFYGLGPDTFRDHKSDFRLKDFLVGATGGARLGPWLSAGGRLEHSSPRISDGKDGATPSVTDLFTPTERPGHDVQPNYVEYHGYLDFNYREPRHNPRAGGHYRLGVSRFHDRTRGQFSFDRLDIDIEQYLSILKERRVLALRTRTSLATPGTGQTIPYYMLGTLGGSTSLRGFRDFRFRDANLLLLQAEYRWEIYTALEAALFYDAGAVAPSRQELSLGRLESDYGIGFRFGTKQGGVFLRVDAAFGSREGKRLHITFSNVF